MLFLSIVTALHLTYLTQPTKESTIPPSLLIFSVVIRARSFRNGDVKYLIVTDVAARGIDVPLLDNVVHFHFPSSPKLFVHRCGRAARQGRVGFAFSIVEPEELAYMVDVHTFLGRTVIAGDRASLPQLQTSATEADEEGPRPPSTRGGNGPQHEQLVYDFSSMTPDLVHTGILPPDRLDSENEQLRRLLSDHAHFRDMHRVCENAMKQYRRTRSEASHTGVKLAKALVKSAALTRLHPLVCGLDPGHTDGRAAEKANFIKHLQTFRPAQTVLETGVGTGVSVQSGLAGAGRKKQVLRNSAGVKVMQELRAAVSWGLERTKVHHVAGNVLDGEGVLEEKEEGEVGSVGWGHEDGEDGLGEAAVDEYEEDGAGKGGVGGVGDDYLEAEELDPRGGSVGDGVGGDLGRKPRMSKHQRKQMKRSRPGGVVEDRSHLLEDKGGTSHRQVLAADPASGDEVVSMNQTYTEQQDDMSRVTSALYKSSTRSFKDPRFYMAYGTEDAVANFAEQSMQPQSGLRRSEAMSKRL